MLHDTLTNDDDIDNNNDDDDDAATNTSAKVYFVNTIVDGNTIK